MDLHENLLKGKIILVIDDDLVSVALMKKILGNVRCKVIAAKDAFEGWHLIQTEKPDAVFIDIVMPYVNGVTLFEYVRSIPKTRTLPCLFFTSTPTETYIEKIAKLGCGYMVTKPVTPEVVIDKLAKVLESKTVGHCDKNIKSDIAIDLKTIHNEDTEDTPQTDKR